MLKGALLQNNFFLTPQLALMDFETAARNALKAVCPQMTLKACCFHFTLCIWRVVISSYQHSEMKTNVIRI
jgi:transposase-like protein